MFWGIFSELKVFRFCVAFRIFQLQMNKLYLNPAINTRVVLLASLRNFFVWCALKFDAYLVHLRGRELPGDSNEVYYGMLSCKLSLSSSRPSH